jgi:hypothetical protein
MQTSIVILIVAAAAFYVGRMIYRRFKNKGGCACGCSCCGDADACIEPSAGRPPVNIPDHTDH